VQKSFSCIQLSKAFYFHSDPGIPGANPMYLNVRTYSMKGFRIIFLATAASSRLVGGPPQTCTSHCVYSNVKSMPFEYHERNAPCMCACVHVCVCECVFKRAYMCKNIAFVCVFSIKHAHAFIMAKDVSLCVCMCSNGPVCVHSSIAKKEVCVCACMFEGVCVCI
jgi:hypothetical protein